MTDTVSSSNDSLESLLAQYEAGISNYETSDIVSWLNARGEIENRYDELTPEQSTRLENADSDLVEKAGLVAARLAATPGSSLRELRQATPHPSEQWWWYLDVLSHVSDHYESGETKPAASTASRLLTIVELVVLAVAIFLLVQRLLPAASTPAPTPFPTPSPAPTATLDPAAFDLSTATVYKAPNDVIEILLPKTWQPAPTNESGSYAFYYGNAQSPTAIIQISIGPLQQLSASVSQLATPPATSKDLVQAFKDSFQAQQIPPDAKFSDIVPVKVGKLDGVAFVLNVPASAQSPAVDLELRAATLPNGKAVLTFARVNGGLWAAAKPAIDKMMDSLVVNADAIPTATPTPTPIPLELTATALQQQVATVEAQMRALTPTSTPAPTDTPLPTQQATQGS
jgi:hypothetical protein